MSGDAAGPDAPDDVSPEALLKALSALLKDHAALNLQLVDVPYDWQTEHHRIQGKFYYLAFRDGAPKTANLVQYLYECLIPYCLPRKKIDAALKDINAAKDYARIVRLNDSARQLFIKARQQLEKAGEPGELLLYALLEWALSAPRIVSKMYLKTNDNMPVHGTDGIHIGYESNTDKLTIYFGESKIYQDFSSAAASAFKSISEFVSNNRQVTREIEILNDLSDIDALEDPFKSRLYEYVNPYSTSAVSDNMRVVHACLLGFEYAAYNKILQKKPHEVEEEFRKKYLKRVAAACRVVDRRYSAQLPPTANLHLFLVPFPSVEDFRKRFFELLGTTP